MEFLVQYIYLIYYTVPLYLVYSKNYVLSILYDIIVLETSTMFYCNHMTMWLWCQVAKP